MSHYGDVIMGVLTSQITSLTIVYSTVYSGADQRKDQSSAPLDFTGNSPVTGEFPAQIASNTENVSIWWRHHATMTLLWLYMRVIKSQFRHIFGQQFVQCNDKQEKSEIHCTGPLWGRSTGDHWIRIPKDPRCCYGYSVCLLTFFTLIHGLLLADS